MYSFRHIIKKAAVISMLLLFSAGLSFAKTKMDEGRFQLGFGVLVSTNDLLGMIENVRMMQGMSSGTAFQSSHMTDEQIQTFIQLDPSWQRAIVIANILGNMEYGLQLRLLYKALILETDLMFLPYESTTGKLNFTWNLNAGLRAPFFIMPYLTGGVNFTFSVYPEAVSDVENWKSSWGSLGKFSWRPGINFKAGLDLKFKRFSVGAYYQYMIEDFQEFSYMYERLLASDAAYAGAALFGSQSRFGASICWYIF